MAKWEDIKHEESLSEYSNYVDDKTDEVNGADDANYTIVLD